MKKCLVISFCALMAVAISQAASAAPIALTVGAGGSVATDHILGEVFQPFDLSCSGQLACDIAAVTGLLGVAPGTRTGADPEYYRATGTGAISAAPTATGAVLGGSSALSFVLSSAFTYLVVTYDGPQAGAQVYYIGDLAAGTTISVVPFAYPNGVDQGTACGGVDPGKTGGPQPSCGDLVAGSYYGMTHWTLLNPTSTTSVPDGGATAALIGLGMFGLGILKRRFRG